jgi:hypothetical protein
MHVDLWQTAFKGSELRGSVRKTRRLSPTLMIADYDLELRLFQEAPAGITVKGDAVTTHLKHVMEKRGNEWKGISPQNTVYSNAPNSR